VGNNRKITTQKRGNKGKKAKKLWKTPTNQILNQRENAKKSPENKPKKK